MTAKGSGVSTLETHLGYWVRFVSNHVSHAFSRRLGAHDITVAEWVVLRALYGCDSRIPSALADMIGMTRGAVSKLADRLVLKKLVTRTTSNIDRRYQALALSAPGRALVPRLATLADENDAAFFGHLTAAERRTIEQVMRTIVQRHQLKSRPID